MHVLESVLFFCCKRICSYAIPDGNVLSKVRWMIYRKIAVPSSSLVKTEKQKSLWNMFLKPFSRKKETFFWVAESRKTLSRKATRSWIYKMKSYNPLYIKAEFKLCSIKKSFGLWKLKSLDLILAPTNYTKSVTIGQRCPEVQRMQ